TRWRRSTSPSPPPRARPAAVLAPDPGPPGANSGAGTRWSAADLVDLLVGLGLGVRPDLLEADPHERTEERHDQDGDGGGDHPFAAVATGASVPRWLGHGGTSWGRWACQVPAKSRR